MHAEFPFASTVNDVFGFFIWSGSGSPQNVALLPNSTQPVGIATVNPLHNTYCVTNDYISSTTSTQALELNGMTTLLKTVDYQFTAGEQIGGLQLSY